MKPYRAPLNWRGLILVAYFLLACGFLIVGIVWLADKYRFFL